MFNQTASNRTAKFVSALFASLLAGAPLATVSHSTAQAAGDCLAGPKGAPRDGGHWYYRVDRATQRHCWYVGDRRHPAAQRPIADAHAELPLPQPRVEPASIAPEQQIAAAPADTSRANTGMPNTPASLIAARWPWPSDLTSQVTPEAAIAAPVANAPSNAKVPLPATIPLAAADMSSGSRPGAIRTLLTVVMGALSLAAVMGGAIFGFGGTRRIGRPEIRSHPARNLGCGRYSPPATCGG